MVNKTNRGGHRPGAGRPKTGAKSTVLTFRVPEVIAEDLKVKIKALIDRESKKIKPQL